jgi:hypothetical protein
MAKICQKICICLQGMITQGHAHSSPHTISHMSRVKRKNFHKNIFWHFLSYQHALRAFPSTPYPFSICPQLNSEKRKNFQKNFFGTSLSPYHHALRAPISGPAHTPPHMIFHMPKSMVKKEKFFRKKFFLAFFFHPLSCPQGIHLRSFPTAHMISYMPL